jgi:tRNA (guanine37-N1)-methyltransferase
MDNSLFPQPLRHFKILTLFPEMFSSLTQSVIGRAVSRNILNIEIVDIREFSLDKHKKCDDKPFGGGAGMVMTPQPAIDAILASDPNHDFLRVYMSPKGSVLSTQKAKTLSQKNLLIFCGHYEGIDQRIIDNYIDMEISIGDYILTGGEIAAMVLLDSVSRFVPSVLGSDVSAEEESFSDGLLEYPHYTRPEDYNGLKVPEVLLSGHHKNIEKWRREQAEILTKRCRPDLIEKKKED